MDNTLSPSHPGEVLTKDFMKPLGLTQYRLAHDIGVTPIRISQIVKGQRSVSVDTAMRPGWFLRYQRSGLASHAGPLDLEVAQGRLSDRINREVKVLQPRANRVTEKSQHRLQATTAKPSKVCSALSSRVIMQSQFGVAKPIWSPKPWARPLNSLVRN